MLEGLDRLVELQRVDGALGACEQEHGRIPDRRRVIADGRKRCDEQLEAATSGLQHHEAEQRQADVSLQDAEELLRRLEAQQSQVKTNVAYSALLREMDQARATISDSETRILEAMEAIEAARQHLARTEELIAAERTRLDAEETALGEREQKLAGDIERLRGEREGVCRSLGADMLSRYQKVWSRRQPALVLVTGEICTGCRVGIPAQDYIELLKAERLISCGSCQRILLHAERFGAAGGDAA